MENNKNNRMKKAMDYISYATPVLGQAKVAGKVSKFLFDKFAPKEIKEDAREVADIGGKLSSAAANAIKKEANFVKDNAKLSNITPENLKKAAGDVIDGTGNFLKSAAQDTGAGLVRVFDTIGAGGNKLIGNDNYVSIADFANENQSKTTRFLTGERIGSHEKTKEATDNLLEQLDVSKDNKFLPLVGGMVAGAEFLMDVPVIGTLTKQGVKPFTKKVFKEFGQTLAKETSEEAVEKIVKEQFKDVGLTDRAMKDLTKELTDAKSVKEVGEVINGKISEFETSVILKRIKENNEAVDGIDDIIKVNKELDTPNSKTLKEVYEEINFKPEFEGQTPKMKSAAILDEIEVLKDRTIKINKKLKAGKIDEAVAERQLKKINSEIQTKESFIEKLDAQDELISREVPQSATEQLNSFSFDKPRTAGEYVKTQQDKRLRFFEFRKGNMENNKGLIKNLKEEALNMGDKVRRHLQLVRGEEVLNANDNYVSNLYLESALISAKNEQASVLQKSLANSLKRKYGKNAGKVRSEISEYLRMRHAPEFNKFHADVEDAAGVSTKEALEIVKRIGDKYKDDSVFKNTVDVITEYNKSQLKQAYKSGLISKESFDTIRDSYKYYVPYFRVADGSTGARTALEFGSTNKTVNFAEGGDRLVDDVVDSSFYKGQSVNNAVVQNESKKTMGKFIMESEQDYVKKNFSVKAVSDEYALKPKNEVDFYSEGKRYVINMPTEYIEPWTQYGFKSSPIWKTLVGSWNTPVKFYSKMLTTYNPAFKPVSFIRDGMEAVQVANDVMGTGFTNLTGLNPNNLRKAWKGIYDYQKGLDTPNAKLYNEAVNLYGISSGRYAKSLEKGGVSQFSKLTENKSFPTLQTLSERFSNADELFENSVRQTHYIRARQAGFTPKDAAIVAQEAGINFSKSGRFTEFFAPAFMFLNATVQGNTNFVRSLKNPKILAQFSTGISAASLGQESWNSMMFGPDWRDDVDSYILNSHVVIGVGYNDDGEFEYIKIPIPHGAMPFWTMANGAIDIANKKNTVENVVTEAAGMAATTLSPFGGGVVTDANINTTEGSVQLAKSLGNEVLPSPIKPLYQAKVNQNHFGNSIVLEEKDSEGEGTGVYKSSDEFGNRGAIEAVSDKISKGVESIFGEGKYSNQRMIKHLLSNYIATGVGKEVFNTTGEIIDSASGEKVDLDKVVVTSKFFGRSNKNSESFRISRKYDRLMDVAGDNESLKRDLLIEDAIQNQFLDEKRAKKYNVNLTHNHALMNASPESVHYFKKLVTATDDDEWEESRVAAIQKMRKSYSEESHLDYGDMSFSAKQYKGLVEYVAGEQGVHKLSDGAIKKWYSEQGIKLGSKDVTKSGKVSKTLRNKIEDRSYIIKRYGVSGASEAHERFSELEKSLKEGEINLTQDEENEFFSDQYALYKDGLMSKYQFDKAIKKVKKASAEANVELLIERIEQGADPRTLLAEIRTAYSEETEALFIDYLKQSGRIN